MVNENLGGGPVRTPAFDGLDAKEQAEALAAVAKVVGPLSDPAAQPVGPVRNDRSSIELLLDSEEEEFRAASVPWLTPRNRYGLQGYGPARPVQVLQADKLPEDTREKIDRLAADGYSVFVSTGSGGIEVGAPNGKTPPTRWSPVPEKSLRQGLKEIPNPVVAGAFFGAGALGSLVTLLFSTVAVAAGVAAASALVALLAVAWLGALPPRSARPTVTRYAITRFDRMAIATATVDLPADSPEVKLTRMAADIAQEIEASPAWESEWLTQQRALYSPEAAAKAIADDARKVGVMRQNLAKAAEEYKSSEVAAPARNAVAQKLAVIDTIHVRVLMERVAAMWSYRQHLGEFERELERLQQQEQLSGFDEEMSQLNAQLGVAAFDLEQTQARIAELKALREHLGEYVEAMNRTLAAADDVVANLELPDEVDQDDQ